MKILPASRLKRVRAISEDIYDTVYWKMYEEMKTSLEAQFEEDDEEFDEDYMPMIDVNFPDHLFE